MVIHKKYLIVIAGPTAVGKSALAIQLAKHYHSEIISADSRQFYKETEIGTAKPSVEEMEEIPHHFINTLSISRNYNIGNFEKDAIQLLNKLFDTHQLLFLVGGSGLYINAVLYGVDEFSEVNQEIKDLIKSELESKGIFWLQEQLKSKDPEYYKVVDTNNPQRMTRALEVCLQSGKPYSDFLSGKNKKRNFEIVKILINTTREELYGKINFRVDEMIKAGLVDEARKLYPFRHLNALNTVGYKELFMHFGGELNLTEATNLIKQKTRNYAKRQLTWFKNQDTYEEFAPNNFEGIKTYIDSILKNQ